ncbi:hypothetical protein VO57_015065 [Citromicrobium bathyomarinum]|nr:hypothetical protein [Citromicrobium sp. JL2201]
MSASQTFPTEVLATVGARGEIEVLGRAYWSRDLSRFAGWTVRVMVPKAEDDAIQVWRGTHFLASADRMVDVGFAAHGAMRQALAQSVEVSRRVRDERRSLVVRRRAELLVELLDQTVENRSLAVLAIGHLLPVHPIKCLKALLLKVRNVFVQHDLGGDGEGAKRAELRLHLAERLFELADAVFEDHPDFPSISAMREAAERDIAEEANRATDAGHRLCGAAK